MTHVPTRYAIVAALVFAGLCFFIASLYIEQRQATIVQTLERSMAEQSERLITLAELTAHNRTDSLADAIIRDCAPERRARFEQLLDDLASLNTSELQEIEPLFDACAAFFAERKAFMVARLQREFEVYEGYITLLQIVEPRTVLAYQLGTWRELVALERTRSSLMSELVTIQDRIIDTLNESGTTAESLDTLLTRAQAIRNEVARLNGEAETLRNQLYTL